MVINYIKGRKYAIKNGMLMLKNNPKDDYELAIRTIGRPRIFGGTVTGYKAYTDIILCLT